MAFLSLLFLPVGLMLRQQIPRLIDEVKKLLRQVPLQHNALCSNFSKM